MKTLAIIGTRGIPNRYGGFEQFAEGIAPLLAEAGWQVVIYSPHDHPYKENNYKGVRIIRKYCPERSLGTVSQFIYDFLCLLDARFRGWKVVLQLGYTSSAIFNFLIGRQQALVTNPDGLEWRRAKYSPLVKRFLKFSEGLAIRRSQALVADSVVIRDYLQETYATPSVYIPYATVIPETTDPAILQHYGLQDKGYLLLVTRFIPENNLDMILAGIVASGTALKTVVVGDYSNAYGQGLYTRYHSENMLFTGVLFDRPQLDALRQGAALYFHGHSAGGTNPSLLDAMACKCLIAAHNNAFNQAVLKEHGIYFSLETDITAILSHLETWQLQQPAFAEANLLRIREAYQWEHILFQYNQVLEEALLAKENLKPVLPVLRKKS